MFVSSLTVIFPHHRLSPGKARPLWFVSHEPQSSVATGSNTIGLAADV
ncbi:conserved hypothetical protein [Ahrensia sp. R2A130]|nr:conserved hypothetical protein [Ahrensia sp. R2A130]